MPSNLEYLATEYRSYLLTMVDWPEAVMEAMSGTYSMEPGVGPIQPAKLRLESDHRPVANGTMAPREAPFVSFRARGRLPASKRT